MLVFSRMVFENVEAGSVLYWALRILNWRLTEYYRLYPDGKGLILSVGFTFDIALVLIRKLKFMA